MYAFLSYQTNDREVAGRIDRALGNIAVRTFLAHERIEVSKEWRLALLNELRETDIFVPIISANYYQSIWCMQEAGIAAFKGMTVISLSVDGTIPQGFLGRDLSGNFGSALYAKEELVAEITSAFVCASLGIRANGPPRRLYRLAEGRP